MSNWQIMASNFWSLGIYFIFLLWMSDLLLGRFPRQGIRQGILCTLLGLALVAVMSFVGMVCYRMGLWKWGNGAGKLIFQYFMIGCKILFLHFLYRTSLRDCCLAELMTEILCAYGEILSEFYYYGKVFDLSVPDQRRTYLFWFLVIAPACLLFCGLVIDRFGLGKIYRKWMDQEEVHKGILFLLVFFPVLYELLRNVMVGDDFENVHRLFPLFFLLAIHLIFVYVERDRQQRQSIIVQRASLRQQAIYIEEMEQMQAELRRFRHDFKNMMAGMYLQAKEGDLDAVRNFIQEMTGDFDRQVGGQIRLLNQLSNIRVVEVKSLLLEKLARMRQEGIFCELEVVNPFKATQMRSTDLCRCLGILVDNAMDEVRGRQDGRIHLMISSRDGCSTFRVKNTLYGTVDFGRLGTAGYTTKGRGRGIGLESYRKILEKYACALSFTAIQDGCFVQELKVEEESTDNRGWREQRREGNH